MKIISWNVANRIKKQTLQADEQILKDSMIRSLYREVEKQIKSNDPLIVDSLNRKISRLETEKKNYYRKYWDLYTEVQEKYGTRWNK